LITTKYLDYFWIKWLANTAHAIWIDRETADFSAFRNAVETIQNGTAVGIAPEGTRSFSGGLLEGKSGTVLLALRSKALIVPVGLTGTESGISKLLHFTKPQLTARFGPAFRLPELERGDRPEQLKNMTDEIMCRIGALLPDSYHGFYAGNPRIRELRGQGAGLPL
jgi:1-acyl-sn-glycerol-3-phosphate acyltransferase